MGSVHKFKRPPKNERQFRGYRPGPSGSAGKPGAARWQLRAWQKGAIAWSALILLAAALWLGGKLLGSG